MARELLNGGMIGIDARNTQGGVYTSARHFLERVAGNLTTSDTDADAFIAASGISGTEASAIQTLVIELKSYGIWTKMHAIYPFVGGTSSTHKWNLKNPLDTNGAYRLAFTGSWTHNANGITGDGSTSYADTFFDCTTLTTTSGSLGLYSRSNTTTGANPYDMGAASATDTQAVICISKYTSGNTFAGYGTSTYPSASGLSGAGMFITNRNSATHTTGYRNGTQIINASDTVSLPSITLYIGACHRGTSPTYFSPKNWSFAFIGNGLTGTEAADYYTAVQAFQTALGRNV